MSNPTTAPTEASETGDPLARDEVTFDQLGSLIEDLAAQLHEVGKRAEASELKRDIEEIRKNDVMDDDVHDELNQRMDATLIRALSGLKQFRRNYEYWERAIAEYALKHRGLSQRDAARYLGVAGSTINRWSQNPLQAQNQQD